VIGCRLLVLICLLAGCDDGRNCLCCGSDRDTAVCVNAEEGTKMDAAVPCNPLTQSGCAAGEKCTWFIDALLPQYVGHVGCAPDGSLDVGDACRFGAPGIAGYDGCKKSLVCGTARGGDGICKHICDPSGGLPFCEAPTTCVTYADLFASDVSAPPSVGVCDAPPPPP
jgi:hypothetical protein